MGIKVGLIAATAFHLGGSVASSLIKQANAKKQRAIYDGKFGDIPYQVAGAVKNITALGVYGMTVRANAEMRMLTDAVSARDHAYEVRKYAVKADELGPKPIIFGVSVLSSETQDENTTLHYAEKAAKAGFEGMVAPGRMLIPIKKRFPELIILNVGIRPHWADWVKNDDQKQTISHLESAEHGAENMAIGRVISNSPSPAETVGRILHELKHRGNPDSDHM